MGSREGARKAREKLAQVPAEIKKEWSRLGGLNSPTSFKNNPELAKEAGRKGAQARWDKHRKSKGDINDEQEDRRSKVK